jgi:pyruvate,orthophosphate dikinase
MTLNNKYIFYFDNNIFNESSIDYNKNFILNNFGNKGKNLANLWHLNKINNSNMKIPFGFIINYQLIKYFLENNKFPEDFLEELKESLKYLEEKTTKKLGDTKKPLILSIRSSGNISLPGVFNTCLNIGLNKNIVDNNIFLKEIYENNNIYNLEIIDQILESIGNVALSMLHDRVKTFINKDDPQIKMGIIVQEMVFGNKNKNSYTGVVFTSNPETLKDEIFGEFLINSQGNILVNGEITPEPISTLKTINNRLHEEIVVVSKFLEGYYKYIQDIEFTVENNELYILQTRDCKLSNEGKILLGKRLIDENKITREEFFKKYNIDINKLQNNIIKEPYKEELVLGRGLGITNNIIEGILVTNYEDLLKYKDKGNIIYGAVETNQNSMEIINMVKGIITMKGGATCHGAVICRGKNIVGILSVEGMFISEDKNGIYFKNSFIANGSSIILDGNKGIVINNKDKKIKITYNNNIDYEFLKWNVTPIKIRINGDTVEDIINGQKFGMDGIGLCRIEHMLLKEPAMNYIKQILLHLTRNTINNGNVEIHEAFLEKYLINEFTIMMNSMKGLPMTIRLLDAPLHEFLQNYNYKEHNPMMGNRGARLMIYHEKLCKLQVKSIFISNFINNKNPIPIEIMIPFIFNLNEVLYIKNLINEVKNNLEKEYKIDISYKFGIMVELPRSVYVIQEIASEVDFISFGTNDLTQMTFGLSRDDSEIIINDYIKKGILKNNPFITLDSVIKEMLLETINNSKKVNNKITFGICGEHAGDEESIKFLATLPLDYISMSPFRVINSRYFLNKYYK